MGSSHLQIWDPALNIDGLQGKSFYQKSHETLLSEEQSDDIVDIQISFYKTRLMVYDQLYSHDWDIRGPFNYQRLAKSALRLWQGHVITPTSNHGENTSMP